MILRILKIVVLLIIFAVVGGVSAYLTLTLIIKSEETVVVPELVGKEVVNVLRILTDLGLNTKVAGAEYSAGVPLNYVIFQNPVAGTELKKGRDVRLIVSKGAETVLVPNIKGISIQQGLVILEQNRLCQGKRSFTTSENVKKDIIIAHTPPPGLSVKRGVCVDLLVSTGTRPTAFKMPDLDGRLLEDAILLIERNNLLLGDVNSVYRKDKLRDAVVGQTPAAGHRVSEGTIVNLEANRKKDTANQPDLEIRRGIGLLRFQTEYGFLKSRIRVRLKRSGFSYDIYDGFINPGRESWFLIPRGNDVTALVYRDDEIVETHTFNN
jgi:serine/threonine-protein kinase